MGRYGSSANEIASVVAFLASEGSGYITGQSGRWRNNPWSDLALPAINRDSGLWIKWAVLLFRSWPSCDRLRHYPWNLYLFLFGVVGWFAVGVLWNDRAIMLIHIAALAAMMAGMTA